MGAPGIKFVAAVYTTSYIHQDVFLDFWILLACIIYDYDKGKMGSLESLACRSVTISIGQGSNDSPPGSFAQLRSEHMTTALSNDNGIHKMMMDGNITAT